MEKLRSYQSSLRFEGRAWAGDGGKGYLRRGPRAMAVEIGLELRNEVLVLAELAESRNDALFKDDDAGAHRRVRILSQARSNLFLCEKKKVRRDSG